MKTASGRTHARRFLTALTIVVLAGNFTAATARADDRQRYDDRNDYRDYQRAQVQHNREWRHRNRVYYGRNYYADPPPAVIYAPPPQPYGLNLMFNLGRR